MIAGLREDRWPIGLAMIEGSEKFPTFLAVGTIGNPYNSSKYFFNINQAAREVTFKHGIKGLRRGVGCQNVRRRRLKRRKAYSSISFPYSLMIPSGLQANDKPDFSFNKSVSN